MRRGRRRRRSWFEGRNVVVLTFLALFLVVLSMFYLRAWRTASPPQSRPGLHDDLQQVRNSLGMAQQRGRLHTQHTAQEDAPFRRPDPVARPDVTAPDVHSPDLHRPGEPA